MKLRILGIALLAVFITAAAVMAVAQGAAPHPMMQMARQLGLSQTQIGQIKAIVRKFHSDAKGVWQSSASAADKKAQVKTLRDSAIAAINGVLTADQLTKATQMKFAEKVLRPHPFPRLEAALRQLGLSSTQKTAVQGIVKDWRTQAKAIRTNTSLDKAAKVAQLKALRQQELSKIKGQLTPDQLTKFQSLIPSIQPGTGTSE